MIGITAEQRAQLREWTQQVDSFPPSDQEEVALAIGMAMKILETSSK